MEKLREKLTIRIATKKLYFMIRFGDLVVISVLLLLAYLVGSVIAFLISSIFETSIRLLDKSLLFTLWVAEVPIAIFLRYIFGEGRRSDWDRVKESIDVMKAKAEFSHLTVAYPNEVIPQPPLFPSYYVINDSTNQAYLVDKHILWMEKFGIIKSVIYENAALLLESFRQRGISLNRRKPRTEELEKTTP